jgi:hypothetical protein
MCPTRVRSCGGIRAVCPLNAVAVFRRQIRILPMSPLSRSAPLGPQSIQI